MSDLTISIPASAEILINDIMAGSTKGHPVTDGIPEISELAPGFNMVNDRLSKVKKPIASLASEIVPSQTRIPPFDIKDIVTPLNIISGVLFRLRTFSLALLGVGSLIRARGTTESPLLRIVRIHTKWFRASLASLIVVHNQYEYCMKGQA